jgi:hypothetical protein
MRNKIKRGKGRGREKWKKDEGGRRKRGEGMLVQGEEVWGLTGHSAHR